MSKSRREEISQRRERAYGKNLVQGVISEDVADQVKTGWTIRLHHSSSNRHKYLLQIVIEVETKIETGSVKKARTGSL